MNDERLRAAYERLMVTARERADDVSPEEMLALAEGRGTEAERLRTAERVMRTEASRRDFELLRAGLAASRPRVSRLPRMLMAAAGVLAAVGLGTVAVQQWRVNPLRGNTEQIELVGPSDAPATSQPLVFSWHAVPDAISYEIQLVESNGTLVDMATVTDTSWALPATTRLSAGVEYRWWVRASRVDGSVIEAPPRRLVLSP